VLAFYVVARYSVMVFRVRAGKRSVRHLIVEGSMRGVCNIVRLERRAALGDGGMSELDDGAPGG
jgi:hypothetical protein